MSRNYIRLLVRLLTSIYIHNLISSSNGESYSYFLPHSFLFPERQVGIMKEYESSYLPSSPRFTLRSQSAEVEFPVEKERMPFRVPSPWLYLNDGFQLQMTEKDYNYKVDNGQTGPQLSLIGRRNNYNSDEDEDDTTDEDDDESSSDDDNSNETNDDDIDQDDDVKSVTQVKKNVTSPQFENIESDSNKYPYVVNAILDELYWLV